MKNMESMKKGDIMKKDDIKEKLYVGFDIHKEKLQELLKMLHPKQFLLQF